MRFIVDKASLIPSKFSGNLIDEKSYSGKNGQGTMASFFIAEPSPPQREGPGNEWRIVTFSESVINALKTLSGTDEIRIEGSVSVYKNQKTGQYQTSFIARKIHKVPSSNEVSSNNEVPHQPQQPDQGETDEFPPVGTYEQ